MSACTARLLILDDDADVALAARMLLRRHYGAITVLSHPDQLSRELEREVPDVVLLDMNFTPGRTDGAQGLQALAQLLDRPRAPAVIALTAYADVPLAVAALQRGACDFLTKPWDNARLLAAVETAVARRSRASHAAGVSLLLGESDAMQSLRAIIASVAPTEANVLVLGENGVGKELVAQAIHRQSRRAAGPMLAVDMGVLPEATFESELFGHRKGAFTDARSDRDGRFQAARGGTLFLDEIGNLPLAAQAKLLAALERRSVTPLGSNVAQAVDVRIVSATNLPETALFDAGVFRADLLFRLNTIVIRVPPLRERRADIAALVAHYLRHYEGQYGQPARPLVNGALEQLQAWSWPGNVRALRHACERAAILARDGHYRFDDFGLGASAPLLAPSPLPAMVETPGTLGELERGAIEHALEQARGNISAAARQLGLSRAALYRKLEKHGL